MGRGKRLSFFTIKEEKVVFWAKGFTGPNISRGFETRKIYKHMLKTKTKGPEGLTRSKEGVLFCKTQKKNSRDEGMPNSPRKRGGKGNWLLVWWPE